MSGSEPFPEGRSRRLGPTGLPPSLVQPELEPLLAELERVADPLARATAARRALAAARGVDFARAVAELAALRARARARFPDGALRHLTPKGLEQATRPAVAALRAARLREALAAAEGAKPGDLGEPAAFDATSGLGSDALALARAGFAVQLADADEVTLRCARANLAEAGCPARSAVVARAPAVPWRKEALRAGALVLDPDRRPTTRSVREADPGAWSPSFTVCLALAREARAACIKVAPAADPSALGLAPCAVEASWVSHAGELVEVAVWTGAAAARGATREAVVLDSTGAAAATLRGEPVPAAPLSAEAALCAPFLVEPDPAVIRSGLIGVVCRDAGLAPIGPELAYLGGSQPGPPALTRSWRVLAATPLDPRRVRRTLDALDIGPVTVMKRGHPDPAEVLARRLSGAGARHGLVAVARLAAGHAAFVLDAMSSCT